MPCSDCSSGVLSRLLYGLREEVLGSSTQAPGNGRRLYSTNAMRRCWRWRTRTSRIMRNLLSLSLRLRSRCLRTATACKGKIEIACLLDQHVKVLGDLRCEAY
ncbi:hypothetical protein KC323_g213 [Hortaea werneckii]|nr:hypothetical protein KC323_g213 [Hortaea werneckii]